MKRKQMYIILAVAVFAAGVVIGGFCSISTKPDVIYEYFAGHRGGSLGMMTGTAAHNAVFVWAVLFFSAFFRFGIPVSMLAVFAKGFTNGFAITAILRFYGMYGLFMSLQDILYVPLVVYFAAAVCAESPSEGEKKGFVLFSLLILLLMLATASLGSVMSYIAGKYLFPALEIKKG